MDSTSHWCWWLCKKKRKKNSNFFKRMGKEGNVMRILRERKSSSEIWYCREGTSREFMLMMMTRRRRLSAFIKIDCQFLVIDHVLLFGGKNCTLSGTATSVTRAPDYLYCAHTCRADSPLRVPMHKLQSEGEKTKLDTDINWQPQHCCKKLIITMSKIVRGMHAKQIFHLNVTVPIIDRSDQQQESKEISLKSETLLKRFCGIFAVEKLKVEWL